MSVKALNFQSFNKENLRKLLKEKGVLIGLLCVLFTILVAVALFFIFNKQPKSYDDYLAMMDDAMKMEEYATMQSGAYKGLEEQLGVDAYEALVLAVPQEEGSLYYQTQQNNLGGAKNEADHARALVQEHEAAIREKGGIVTLADLSRVDTGTYSDAMARAKITGRYDEYVANLKAGGDKALEEARRAAAYEQ